MKSHIPHTGERVAHVGIDDPKGGAQAGIVKEYIGDEESGIVIVEGPDGRTEGFDRREVRTLVGVRSLTSGFVILHPRHFLALFKRLHTFLFFVLAIVSAIGLNSLAWNREWSAATSILVGVILLLTTVILVIASDHARLRRELHKNQDAQDSSRDK
jgi:hypothetical protein